MRFRRAVSGHLHLVPPVVTQLDRFRQRWWWSREAGGVLLGRHLVDSADLWVDEATVPQRGDRRTRMTFYRSDAHRWLALQRWEESGGICGHLGLWHTHPEPLPQPSHIDFADWRHALAADRFEGDSLVFLIVGQQRLRCWQGWKDESREFVELTMETASQ